MQLKTKSGLALVTLGVGVFAAWSLWTKTRNFVPVDVPISMAAGTTVRSEFKLNFDGLYLIEIGAEKAIPLDRLRCLMAVEPDATRCQGIPPAIGATWILSRDGQEIGRGNSQEMHSAPVQSDYVARVIGEFQGRAGRRYKLQVVFASDGRSLAAAHPRLKVGVSGIAFEDMQAAGGLILSITFICILFGAVLMLIAFFAKRGSSDAGSPA